MNGMLIRILTSFGSVASIGFGLWHFTVPKTWKWYSYMEPSATELVLAVRAINIFFSLSLVLFGLMNILLVNGEKTSRYSLVIVLGATCILWLSRVILQVRYPQGSMNPLLQYGMLASFSVIFSCYLISLALLLSNKRLG